MKHIRRFALIMCMLVFAVAASVSVLLLSGCHKGPKVPLTATYYADVDGEEYNVSFTEDSLSFNVAGDNLTGTYQYEGGTEVVFDLDDVDDITATLSDGTLSFTYEGTEYEMLEKINYTVTYDLDGGNGTQSATVVNGRTAARPADPDKSNAVFLDWYADASFTQLYDFNTPVTGNITVYARFVERVIAESEEFTVSFDATSAGETIGSILTVNHVVYDLPVPANQSKEFLGWWMSDYQDGKKLTAQVSEGQELDENAILYAVWKSDAPAVSVTESGVSWNSLGVGIEYRVTIAASDGTKLVDGRPANGEYLYDFSAQAAGDYTITVTAGDASTTAYYKNKALARVSLFVVDGNALSFNEVENATDYLLTYTCGTPGHVHKNIKLTEPAYNFADCDMSKGGMQFTVVAEADGYAASTSDTFVFERHLDAVTGLKVNSTATADVVTWNAVENVQTYLVEVAYGNEVVSEKVTGTEFDIQNFYGALTITVTPVAFGYNSPDAAELEYNKTRLATPSNIHTSGNTLVWDEVEGAQSYIVTIGGVTHNVADGTSYTFAATDIPADADSLIVTVQAVAAAEANNSLVSAETNVLSLGTLVYENGMVSWSPVAGATSYEVMVNDGEAVTVSDAVSSAVTLTKAGENTISVRYMKDGKYSKWVSVTVNAAAVTFNSNDEASSTTTAYLAEGDVIPLPEVVRTGYSFAGWYTNVENGKLIASNTIFDGEEVSLFAHWTGNKYTVTLTIPEGEGSFEDGSKTMTLEVVFGEEFAFPAPKSSDGAKAFGGWWTSANGGFQFTDPYGESLTTWANAATTELYPHWLEAFKYVLITNPYDSDEQAYSLYHGDGINYLTEVTVPAMYNGLPVTTIDGGCFNNCRSLRTIRLPDSIYTVVTGDEGANSTGSSFYGCSNLVSIIVYDASEQLDFNYEIRYSAENGVLMFDNPYTGMELVYVPRGIKGTLTIPDGVSILHRQVFTDTNVSTVIIPASVTEIATLAFEDSSVTSIKFLEPAEGEDALPLTIGDQAFYGRPFASIDLPARVTSILVSAFDGCSLLAAVNIIGDNGVYSSEDGVLFTDEGATLVFYPRAKAGTYTIPSTVLTIAEKAFYNCDALTAVTISGGVTTIEKSAFENCSNLATLTFLGDAQTGVALTIGDRAFYSCTSIASVVLPSNLVALGANAFGYTTMLSTVTVSVNGEVYDVSEISYSNNAFSSANSTTTYLKTLIIGQYVPTLDINGIFGSTGLERVEVDPNNKNYSSDEYGVLFDYEKTQLVYYPTGRKGEYVIPETVERIGAGVFLGKTGLTKITIGSKIGEIADGAFSGCTGLTEVIFTETPAGATEVELKIGAQAFRGCTALTSLDLPSRLREIGMEAFSGCSNITSLVIPEGVTSIGHYAFYNCDALTTVSLPSTLTYLGVFADDAEEDDPIDNISVFDNCNSLAVLTIASGNKVYAAIDNVVYGIGSESGKVEILYFSVMRNQGKNGVITVPSSVNEVKTRAFYGADGLKTVIFEDKTEGTVTFGEAVFSSISSVAVSTLESVELPAGLTTIVTRMFYNSDIKSIVIPNTVTSIGVAAFYGCDRLTTVTFEAGGTESLVIADGDDATNGAFIGCSSLNDIVLPDRTTEIGDYAFYGTSTTGGGLKSISVPSSLTRIGDYAFTYTSALEDFIFRPVETTNSLIIERYAFYTSGIKTIDLPDNLTSIGTYAFAYSSLVRIDIPASVTILGVTDEDEVFGSVFYNCPELTTVYFEEGSQLTEMGRDVYQHNDYINMFAYCEKLVSINLEACTKLTAISNNAFDNCLSLKSIKIPASVKEIGKSVFSDCESLTSIEFITEEDADGVARASLTSVGDRAFQNSGLTSFAFPETKLDENGELVSITLGDYLFEACRNIKTIHLSASITSLGSALGHCMSIEQITISPNNTSMTTHATQPLILSVDVTSTGEKESTEILAAYSPVVAEGASGEYRLPDNITTIADSAFYGQNAIKKLIIPNSVISIGVNSFAYCRLLTQVEFEAGSNLASIGEGAFKGCLSLTSITLPNSVTSLDEGMFMHDYSLKSVVFPAKVDEMYGRNMFFNCYSLESIVLPSVDGGYGRTNFVDFADYCTSLTSVTLPADMTLLPNAMFRYCSALTLEGITNFDKITELGVNAFNSCTSITSINLPNITKMNGSAFSGCTGITGEVYLPNVTSLGSNEFKDAVGVTSAVVGMLESISGAFSGCTNLATLKYMDAEGVLHGKDNAITLPETLKEIGDDTFAGMAMTEVYVPASVEDVGDAAFQNCLKLTYAEYLTPSMADGNTSSPDMFAGCTALRRIVLNNELERISARAFQNCSALTTIDIYDPTDAENPIHLSEEGVAVLPYGNDALSYSTPLASNCFENTGFREVIISAGIKGLGVSNKTTSATSTGYVFRNCVNLEKVVLPDTLVAISAGAFDGCAKLATVQWAELVGEELVIHGNEKEATFPDTLVVLGSYAFGSGRQTKDYDAATYVATAIEKVTIPAGLKAMGNYVFQDCFNLKEAVVLAADPHTTTTGSTVPDGLFDNCTSLEKVVISGSTKTIQEYMFRDCTSLKTIGYNLNGQDFVADGLVQLPSGLTTIGQEAFLNSGLTQLEIPGTVNTIGTNAFGSITVTIAEGSTGITVQNGVWVSSGNQIIYVSPTVTGEYTLPENLTIAAYGLSGSNISKLILSTDQLPSKNNHNWFTGFTGEIVVTLGNSLATPRYAFQNYDGAKITLPEGLTTIGAQSFYGCSELEEVVLPSTVTTFGTTTTTGTITQTFYNCSSLKSISLPEGLTIIGGNMFYRCSALESVNIPSTVKEIDSNAFNGCSSLKNIDLSNVEVVDSSAFSGCTSLTSVDLTNVTTLGSSAFNGCSAIADITLGEKLTSIGSSAFNGTAITEITIPRSVTALPGNVNTTLVSSSIFANCVNLETVILHDGITAIGTNTFSGCTALKTVKYVTASGELIGEDGVATLNEGLLILGYGAFNGTAIESVIVPSTLTDIGHSSSSYAGVFANCLNLKTVIYKSSSVAYKASASATSRTLAANLFRGCTALETVYMPDTITALGSYIFYGCSALKNVYTFSLNEDGEMVYDTLAEGVADISHMSEVGSYTFYGCQSIKSVILCEDLTTISSNLFAYSGLESIDLHSKITTISSGAFNYCLSMKSIVIPASASNLSAAFDGWTAEQSVTIYIYALDGDYSGSPSTIIKNTDAKITYEVVYQYTVTDDE